VSGVPYTCNKLPNDGHNQLDVDVVEYIHSFSNEIVKNLTN